MWKTSECYILCVKVTETASIVSKLFWCVQCIDVGHIVVGVVTALLDAGLLLTLLAVEDGMARDIDQLKITVCLLYLFYQLGIIVL